MHKGDPCNFTLFFGLMILLASRGIAADSASGKATPGDVAIEWRFDKDGDFRGWQPGSHIAGPTVRDGAIRGRVTGLDPILIGPLFEIAAEPLARVEICMVSTAAATAELYWTETTKGQFGGFHGTKMRKFTSIGDGKPHVYSLYPFWHSAKKIIRLRFDPPNAGQFEIRSIRIVRDAANGSSATAWNADELKNTWRPAADAACEGQGALLFSPILAASAEENAFVCVRLATSRAGSARLFCVSKTQPGWDSVTFALRPDGKMHSYNLDVAPLKTWRGQVMLLALQLPDTDPGEPKLESVEIANDPRGPAELELSYFGPIDGINRAGRPVGVTCAVKNLGGDPAENVAAILQPGPGVTVLDGPRKTIGRVSLYLPQSVTWQVRADQPGKIDLAVQLEAKGQTPMSAAAAIELTPSPGVPKSAGVPVPQPVKTKYEIGAFYFPGWSTSGRWQPIRNYPCRKPILGWYDEANPECADWQIKWAVEHGISFFMVDWYWVRGHRHLEHWVHQAYMKAKHRKYLKWAVMWANHNPPNTHSLEDWREVTKYWIDNYFNMPEYYRIDNRPAVFIWSPRNVRNDLRGTEHAAKLYALSQEMARAAGYPGIYFVAMSSHETPEQALELKKEGYQGLTTYHGFGPARKQTGSDYFPYSAILDTCRPLWQQADERAAGMNYMPIVDTGWDARPWHGDKTMVAYGRNPELFGKLCREARKYADETGKRIIAIGPWNEWGEGSYIEPYAEYGFQDLDQIRKAFCEPGDWPPNLIPADVGLGPYDLPPFVAKNAWEFNTAGDLEGWSPNGDLADIVVKDGALSARSTGSDPVLSMPGLQIEANRIRRVSFRMRSDTNGQVQLFWATAQAKMGERTSAHVRIVGDNQFHDYDVDLSTNRNWRGIINAFRFDPAVAPGVKFEIDFIRLRD